MLFAIFVLIILQHTGGTAECPPKSGIYLMHKGVCISENAFLRAMDIQAKANGLHCLLASGGSLVSNVQGQWLYPDGKPINCSEKVNSDNQIGCSYGDQDDGIILYAFSRVRLLPAEHQGVYTCCMPGNCSDDNSDSITVRIFVVEAITNLYVTLPEDVAVIPQTYTVHCITNETCECAQANSTFTYYISMEGEKHRPATQYCEETEILSCSDQFNNDMAPIVENELNVIWKADTTFLQGSYSTIPTESTGDHDFLCLAIYMNIDNELEDEAPFVFVRAPNSAPSGLTLVSISTTSVKINWTVLSLPPDADGYIIYYVTESESVSSVKVVGGNVNEYTLGGLLPATKYSITIRAYQDILGEASDALVVTTDTSEGGDGLVTPSPTPEMQRQSFEVIGGIIAVMMIFLILLAILIVIATLVVLRKRKRVSQHPKPAQVQKPSSNNDEDLHELQCKLYESQEPTTIAVADGSNNFQESTIYAEPCESYTYASVAPKSQRKAVVTFDPKIPVTIPVILNKLGGHVGVCHSNSNGAFFQQFKEIPDGENMTCTVGLSPEMKLLNRFKNIVPYDDNRIVLKVLDHDMCKREYINASFVDGYGRAKKFIATQGPMKDTVVDFWRMVWQERPQAVVMVANLIEGGKSKCEQYWPSSQFVCEGYGPFSVSLMDEQVLPDIVVRNMRIWFGEDADNFFPITQYQFISWPDHGVPEYATPLMTLHKRVMGDWYPGGGPIVVHCSAGVGRTGTFIALDLALEQASGKGEVDIAGITNRLRQQRMKMIQTEEQYIFLHDVILESLLCGNTEISCEVFSKELNGLKKRDPRTGKSELDLQFEKLGQICYPPDESMFKMAKMNEDKNRSTQHLPCDRWRVILFHEHPGYIHASFVKGYRRKRAFIIAQSPMQNTVRDFWKMIVENKVPAIVMLLDTTEDYESVCSPYWTSKGEEYFVKECSCVEESGLRKRELQVLKDNVLYPVTQFQILGWPADGKAKEPGIILEVIEEVIKVQQKRGSGPIVVHCSDTVGRSGVYCALSNALEQCKAERVADIFQAVKAIRAQKPGAVTSSEQYTFIHELVDTYISMYSTYSNFK